MVPQSRKSPQQEEATLDREFASDVLAGLGGAKKFIPFRYFYDKAGSGLFEQICLQPEYYPTRTEAAILEKCAPEIAELANNGSGISVIELGSGSSVKTRILLGQLAAKESKICYFPIDISQSILQETAAKLRAEFPGIGVVGIPRDYREGMALASKVMDGNKAIPQRKLVLFLGSSIGNFEPGDAASFLKMMRESMGPGDLLLAGFDLHKDKRILDAAYNDRQGVTAKFNLNLLKRINAELQGQFDLEKFEHRAFYDERLRRIEMHLVSKAEQDVYVGALGRSFSFEKGETVHTENSYKYDLRQIREMASESGLTLQKCFTDRKKWFGLALFSTA